MRRWVAPALALLAALTLAVGCARDRQGEQPPEVPPAQEQPDIPAGEELSDERAAGIVAQAAGIAPDKVTVLSREVEEGLATIVADVPAHEKLLPRSGGDGEEDESRPRREAVELRWDLQDDRPTDILWTERLQFADEEPVGPQEAEETARELMERWFPEVPVTMTMQPPHRLNRPVYVVLWRGEDDGVLTGDRVVVQVSAVTGLPIAYSQQVARQRPSADEIQVSREQAIEAAREALAGVGVEDAAEMSLEAELILSSPGHPEGGPAWTVGQAGPRGGAVVIVDAMSAEVLETATAAEEASEP
ncbi:MAG: PepSY domain-containing protein [Armatimonadota bacterium]